MYRRIAVKNSDKLFPKFLAKGDELGATFMFPSNLSSN